MIENIVEDKGVDLVHVAVDCQFNPIVSHSCLGLLIEEDDRNRIFLFHQHVVNVDLFLVLCLLHFPNYF